MKLTLDREDLKPEFQDINCSLTKFEHFNSEAKEAIIRAGSATFFEYDHSNYNVIYPTKRLSSPIIITQEKVIR